MITADEALFGTDLDVPQILTNDDQPRARRSDPIQSHMAADRSQRNRRGCAIGVLHIIASGDYDGDAINDLYRRWFEGYGWPKAAWDSPRKRAGELCEDGFLRETDRSIAEKFKSREFTMTDAGRRLLEELS